MVTSSARRPRWLGMALAVSVYLCIYAAWQALRWPPWDRTVVGDAFFFPIALTAIGSFAAAARRCHAHPRLRSAWLLLAAGGLSYLAGDLAQSLYETFGRVPYPSVADAFYLAFYPLILAGLLRATPRRRTTGERVRVALDLAVVGLAAGAVLIIVVLGPEVVASGQDAFKTAVSIAYPVGDMILVLGLGSVVMRPTLPSSELAFRLLGAGLAFFVVGDVVYNYIQLHSTYHGGDLVDSFWMVAVALFAVAGAAQGTPAPGEDEGRDAPMRASWLPYVAVALGFGLLVATERHDVIWPTGAVLGIAVLLATLVSIRQFLAQRDLLRAQHQLTFQALHDPLTGLPNRSLLYDRVTQGLARARRRNAPIAALFVDLDGFKEVNDTVGHAAGDELLCVVAYRLTSVVREADTVARLGGDEFVVLLEELSLDHAPDLIAQRICQAVGRPITIGADATVSVSASVGIALGLDGGANDLLRRADSALYHAKRAGKNRWTLFGPDTDGRPVTRDPPSPLAAHLDGV